MRVGEARLAKWNPVPRYIMKYFFLVAWRYIIGQKPPPVQKGAALMQTMSYNETIK